MAITFKVWIEVLRIIAEIKKLPEDAQLEITGHLPWINRNPGTFAITFFIAGLVLAFLLCWIF